MAEQIRPVLVERIDRFFVEGGADGAEERQAHQRCRDGLVAFLNEGMLVFRRDGKDALASYLDEQGAGISGPSAPCGRAGCARFAAEIVGQLRSYLDTFDRLSRPIPPDVRGAGPLVAQADRTLSPTQVEEVLAPLSNAWRINILLLLSKEAATLAELSKALGLKKGHLQFHLKTLVDPDYAAYDRRTHLYALTPKGKAALDGLASLIGDITSA